MGIVSASPQFVPVGRIPIRSAATSAGAAYATFDRTDSNGMVIAESQIPFYYISAPFLLAGHS